MSNPANLAEIETRIAFLEDQNDELSREFIRLQQDNNRLQKELHALANLIKPLLEQVPQSDGPDDNTPPPHF